MMKLTLIVEENKSASTTEEKEEKIQISGDKK